MIDLAEQAGSFSASVEEMFSPGGLMAGAQHFEFRPQQQEMSAAIAHALEKGSHLVVEAGTGVGKSLAYLLPSVLWAVEKNIRGVVSTHTIHLQEQLLRKDLPLLQKLLPKEFRAALLKGRSNYLCPQRLRIARARGSELFDSVEQEELERLAAWAKKTQDGTLSDLEFQPNHKVWEEVCSEGHACTPKTCSPSSCFFQKARAEAEAAHLVVVNHTLFFLLMALADAGEEEEGYLGAGDFAILDEAHTIESVAARQIGVGLSQFGLLRSLSKLYNPRTKKGLCTLALFGEGSRMTTEAIDATEKFFAAIEDQELSGSTREKRLRRPNWITDTLSPKLQELEAAVIDRAKQLELPEVTEDLREAIRKIRDQRVSLMHCIEQPHQDEVYWIERSGKTRRWLTLNAAPINLAEVLSRMLFRPGNSCIMTSATLSDGRPDLIYFRQRVGAEKIPALSLGSPFDYQKQMKLYLVKSMPDPRDQRYEKELSRWILHFVKLSQARAFVLFTSYQSMQNVARILEPPIEQQDWRLVVQGQGLSREQMLEAFRSGEKPTVLFGTDSFWTGVDVQGEALSNVIITRLPFGVPDHPLIEVKLEEIEKRGGNAFQDYSLPEAVIRLRQGVGRLIRTHKDRGMVVILDNRIVSKSYGRAFLQALPDCPREIL
ncbi:MAG: ATP-dependent DNA helicase [Verrucomicrobiales bacterium]